MPSTLTETIDSSPGERVSAIDMLRGLALVVMVQDHVRSFFHFARFSPTDMTRSDTHLFLTRFITHPAAPVFFLLAGTAAYLALRKAENPRAISRFLLLRGLMLIVLEITAVNFSWFFDLSLEYINLQTLWALGCSMILLAGLVRFPPVAAGVFGIVLIAGHNLLDGITFDMLGNAGWLWKLLHQFGTIKLGSVKVRVVFPLVPWIGIMCAGFWLGAVYDMAPLPRKKRLIALGLSLTAAFFLVRAVNIYGDPYPWFHHRRSLYTVLSFFNCEKYPPSLSFLLMTLGPSLLTLGLLEGLRHRALSVLELFGRVPLFFYLVHLPLIHVLSVAALYARYGEFYLNRFAIPEGKGFGLGMIYFSWVMIVMLLYPLCSRYDAVRRSKTVPLLKYL